MTVYNLYILILRCLKTFLEVDSIYEELARAVGSTERSWSYNQQVATGPWTQAAGTVGWHAG